MTRTLVLLLSASVAALALAGVFHFVIAPAEPPMPVQSEPALAASVSDSRELPASESRVVRDPNEVTAPARFPGLDKLEEVELAAEAVEEAVLEEPELLSDSPFDSESFNDVIGVGGGAGGKFGGRFGGRRHGISAGGTGYSSANETYFAQPEGGFLVPGEHPYSTFSVDVDTGSYSNVRRFLRDGSLPPPAAVRVEEMLNYFQYDYATPKGEHPLALHSEIASCPWNPDHRLIQLGLQAVRVEADERKPANLVFLIDVSGSMNNERKLPLVQAGLRLLVQQLDEDDSVAIVTYASGVVVAMPRTPGHHTDGILAVIDGLRASGSTNGEGGIQRAYELAQEGFLADGVNRVILATDGDFNVGLSDRDELVAMIEQKASSGVLLTVLGFGYGNVKDATLEQLADHGDGHYAYVDSFVEARRLFVDGLTGTLETVAKDVKIQVEFNPVEVAAYRLVGYANRRLADQDFNDDEKDAGDVGAGHSVTALYEIVPAGGAGLGIGVDPPRYQQPRFEPVPAAFDGELCTVKVRYKQPGNEESTRFEQALRDHQGTWVTASEDFRFASAVALFGMTLAGSEHRGTGRLVDVIELALPGTRIDPNGNRAAFIDLAFKARELGAE